MALKQAKVQQAETSAEIATRITALKADYDSAVGRVEVLLGKPVNPKTFETDVVAAQFRAATLGDALSIRTKIIEAQFAAQKIAVEITFLESRRQEVRAAEQCAGAKRYAAVIDGIGRRLMAALKVAADLNDEGIYAHESARRELSDEVTGRYLSPIVFNGMLRSDLVAMWTRATEQSLASTARKIAEIPQAAPRSNAAPAVPGPNSVGRGSRQPITATASQPKPAASLQHQVRLDTPGTTAGMRAARSPDDTSPLANGECRVKVLRSGFSPADDRPQCDRGQIVKMPIAGAKRSLLAGAVEIIETSEAVPA